MNLLIIHVASAGLLPCHVMVLEVSHQHQVGPRTISGVFWVKNITPHIMCVKISSRG